METWKHLGVILGLRFQVDSRGSWRRAVAHGAGHAGALAVSPDDLCGLAGPWRSSGLLGPRGDGRHDPAVRDCRQRDAGSVESDAAAHGSGYLPLRPQPDEPEGCEDDMRG